MSKQATLEDFDADTRDPGDEGDEGDEATETTDQEPPAWAASLMETVQANSEHIGRLLSERSDCEPETDTDQEQQDAPDPAADTSRGYY